MGFSQIALGITNRYLLNKVAGAMFLLLCFYIESIKRYAKYSRFPGDDTEIFTARNLSSLENYSEGKSF